MQVQQLKCFGAGPGEGNPALVIEGDRSGAAARRAFAHDNKLTCVYLDAGAGPGIAGTLDYYYPHLRSPLCLHATLAAAHVLFARQRTAAPLTVATALGGQRLVLTRAGDDLFAGLERHPAAPVQTGDGLLARLLAAPGFRPVSPPAVASVGSPKLLIEVADEAALYGLRPDLDLVVEWGKAHGINGCYVYCRRGEDLYEGRNFNHLDPALEDRATGVAAGALTALLGRGITLLQGRGCLIRTRMDGAAILVGGRAEPIAKTGKTGKTGDRPQFF
jgi:PhzF family phenazine biosynthesis protein